MGVEEQQEAEEQQEEELEGQLPSHHTLALELGLALALRGGAGEASAAFPYLPLLALISGQLTPVRHPAEEQPLGSLPVFFHS